LVQIILGRNNSKFVQIKGIAPLQGEVIAKEPDSNKKLGTDYPWIKGIQVCSNKGPGPL
jgi:hypothetical protein